MSRAAVRVVGGALLALSLACASTPEGQLEAGRRAVEAGDLQAAQRELEAGRAAEQRRPTGALAALDAELGDLYLTYPELGREGDVEGLYKEALSLGEKAWGPDDPRLA